MARTRYIKPDFFEDEKIAKLSHGARLLYIGIWCWADRNGVFEASALKLKKLVFGYDPVTTEWVESLLTEIRTHLSVRVAEYDGKRWGYIRAFKAHQWFHPGERIKHAIPIEIFGEIENDQLIVNAAHGQSDASHIQASDKTECSQTVIGTGIGTVTGAVDCTDAQSPAVSDQRSPDGGGAIDQLKGDEETESALTQVSQRTQRRWLKLYPDAEWIKRELVRAVDWLENNPAKVPKDWRSKSQKPSKGMASFYSRWLNTGYERHRKTLPPSKTKTQTPVSERMLLE